MSILHFSGRFKFHLAYFNNDPKNDARKTDAYDLQSGNKTLKVKFDPALTQEQVHERLLCDPTKYFEFEFSNVKVTKISYDDGSKTQDKENNADPVLGKAILLKGMLVDLAPHLQRGQLYAGKIRITDTLIGRIRKTTQSSVQKSIRISGNVIKNKLFHYSAYFETELYEVYKLVDPYTTEVNSKFLRELNDLNLKIFFTLCRYDINSNEGEVYGYISQSLPLLKSQGLLIKNRKLSINSSIFASGKYQDMINDLKIEPGNEGTYPRATFEIMENEVHSLLVLRYMEIMPFIDYNNNIPNYQCYIILSNKEENTSTKEIIVDCSYEVMKKSGGITVIKLSDEQKRNIEKLKIIIKVKKSDTLLSELLIEPPWNIILDGDECIKMYSSESIRLKGKVFHENRLYMGEKLLILETEQDNPKSPLVAWFEKEEVVSKEGKFEVGIISRNLENSGQIVDPVTEEKIEGDLPWDRYYGNGLIIRFKTIEEQSSEVNIMVRVIHKFEESKVPTFEDIKKLFSYYARYYPWIHVRIEDCNYFQFFGFNQGNDLKNRLSRFRGSIKTRLANLHDEEWYKMPRSRDFPKYGDIAIEKFLENSRGKAPKE
jgi:hypothetical protein